MNERFLEIAKQAGLKFPSETALSPIEEKFAALIVQECLKLNKFQLTSIPLNQEYWDEHNYGFAAAVFRTQSVVKEHFGVES